VLQSPTIHHTQPQTPGYSLNGARARNGRGGSGIARAAGCPFRVAAGPCDGCRAEPVKSSLAGLPPAHNCPRCASSLAVAYWTPAAQRTPLCTSSESDRQRRCCSMTPRCQCRAGNSV
jgi:hypothetical protein